MFFFRYSIYLLLFLFPFGQIVRAPFDLLVFLTVVIWLGWHWLAKKPFPKTPLFKAFLLFLSAAALSLLLAVTSLSLVSFGYSSLYLLRLAGYFGLYFVILELCQNRKLSQKLLQKLQTSLLVTAIFALIQYWLYPNLRNLSYLGWDPHLGRAFGTFFDPNFFGLIMVVAIFIILFQKKFLTRNFFFAGFYFLLLLLSYSRSAYLAFAVGLGLWFLLKKRLLLVFLPTLLIFAGVLLLPQGAGEGLNLSRTATINSRLVNDQEALAVIQKKPLFGVGFNTLRFYSVKDGPLSHSAAGFDNSLLFITATAGLFGLLTYLNLWYQSLRLVYRKKTFFPEMAGVTLAIFSSGFFINSLFYPAVLFLTVFLWGITHSSLQDRPVTG